MSTATERPESPATTPGVPADRDHAHEHPSDAKYVKVALILGVITAFEVGTYFLDEPSTTMLVATLIPMMVAKFVIVIAYFMHLRYDNPLFKRVFVFGLLLAIGVYAIALLAFEYFDDAYLKFLQG